MDEGVIGQGSMVGNASYDMVGVSKMGGSCMYPQRRLVLEDSYPPAING
jgi:hypothetical protein